MNVGAVHFGKAYQVTGLDDGRLEKFCKAATNAHPGSADWFAVPEKPAVDGGQAQDSFLKKLLMRRAKQQQGGETKAPKNRFFFLTSQDAADWTGLQVGLNALFPKTDSSPMAEQMRSAALENMKHSFVASREHVDILDITPVRDAQKIDFSLEGGSEE